MNKRRRILHSVMMKLLIISGLICTTLSCFAQPGNAFPSIDCNDIPEAVFDAPRTYPGTSLYGYMDGGADLYLEYGCSEAWIDEFVTDGRKYVIEIFRMDSPEDAFGIYSVSRYQCSSAPFLNAFSCLTQYQLQLTAGAYYVNIINRSGTGADSAFSIRVGQAILSKIKESPADFSSYLPGISTESMNRDAVLVKGSLGLWNGAPDLADYFADATGYYALILKQTGQTLLSVKFFSPDDSEAFLTIFNQGAKVKPGQNPSATSTVNRISDTHLLIRLDNR